MPRRDDSDVAAGAPGDRLRVGDCAHGWASIARLE